MNVLFNDKLINTDADIDIHIDGIYRNINISIGIDIKFDIDIFFKTRRKYLN